MSLFIFNRCSAVKMWGETSVSTSFRPQTFPCAVHAMLHLTVHCTICSAHCAQTQHTLNSATYWFWFLFQNFSCHYTNFLVENYRYHNPHLCVCVCVALTELFGWIAIAITSAPSYTYIQFCSNKMRSFESRSTELLSQHCSVGSNRFDSIRSDFALCIHYNIIRWH